MVDDPFDVLPGEPDTIVLRLHVQPGAGRTAVTGRHGDALKVKVAAPPEGGRANQACLELVAKLLGTKVGAVELVSGPSSRSKRVRVTGVAAADASRAIRESVAAGNKGAGPGVRPTTR